MRAADSASTITPADRLGLTLFLATAIHGMVILGLSFGVDLQASPKVPPSLDVILVQTQSEQAPEDTERLAQANQQASGSADEGTPSSPFTSLNPRGNSGAAPVAMHAASPQRPDTPQVQTITARQADKTVSKAPDTQVEEPEKPLTGQELVDRSLQIARLSAEISEREERYAKRPRIHYVDAVGAKSVLEASYIEAWVDRVERLGTLNYPDEAVRRRLDGRLILNVLINRDGKVLRAEVAQSSGHQVLDDAALRIVELASPFAEFPVEMRKSYDQLMITRTWVFRSDTSSLRSERR